MIPEHAKELLDRIGCRRIRVIGGEIKCSCPHPENHVRGDRRPSFSASVSDGDGSPYFCFSCHASGTLEGLAIHTGNTDLVPDWKPKKVRDRSWMNIPLTNAGKFRHLYVKKQKPVLFRDDYLKSFIGVLSGYLIDRGITISTAKTWELGVDEYNNRATFTLRDHLGRLGLVIGRDTSGRSRVKYSNYVLDQKNKRMVPFIDHDREIDFVSPTKSHFMYGEHKASIVSNGESDRICDDLIVVEGAIDVLKVWQYGYNVVAVLGSHPSDIQIEKMVMITPNNKRIIVMADGDDAGKKLTAAIGEKMGSRIPVFEALLGDGRDPGESTIEEVSSAINSAKMLKSSMKKHI